MDIWWFRTRGEVDYCYRLADLDTTPWDGRYQPTGDALCFARPILRMGFRYLDRLIGGDWYEKLRWERRTRSRTGFFVPLQCIEFDSIRPLARARRYVAVPPEFSRFEVPRGFLADLPPVLTYFMTEFTRDPTNTGFWVVF